jgi:hypothetical protein
MSSHWKNPPSPLREGKKWGEHVPSSVKSILNVFSDSQGVVHYEFVLQAQTVNQHHYIDKLQHLHKMYSKTDPKSENQENGFSNMKTPA